MSTALNAVRFESKHKILVARVVAIPNNKLVPVRVANLAFTPITLYRGQGIGNFCPLAVPGETFAYGVATGRYHH